MGRFVLGGVSAAILCCVAVSAAKNFVVIYADDYGYGDVAAYKQPCRDTEQCPGSYTPHLDQMAAEGMRFTSWMAPHPVCSPSRASMLTGRYPIRTNVFPGVFSPQSPDGLPPGEITIAKALQAKGYASFLVGKWHLGDIPPFLPPEHGFTHGWAGIPFSHDYCPCRGLTNTADDTCRPDDPPCPLFNNRTIVQQPANLSSITDYYADTVVDFLQTMHATQSPFFVTMTPQHTHHPQFAAPKDVNSSKALGYRPDAFGDSNIEMDRAIGRVLEYLRTSGLVKDTLVFFSSDNGPSLIRGSEFCGSSGALNCGKFTTWQGGMRVPGIAWGAGVQAGAVHDGLVAAFDIFPTVLAQAGVPLPADRVIDGKDLTPVLSGSNATIHDSFILYGLTGKAQAVRVGSHVVHLYTDSKGSPSASGKDVCGPPTGYKDGLHATFDVATGTIQGTPWVFDLDADIGERHVLDPSSPAHVAAVAAAAQVLVAAKCVSKGDAGCQTTPPLQCTVNGTLPQFPPCNTITNKTCTFEPWTPPAECLPQHGPFTPTDATNCTWQANTRQDGDPVSQGKASSREDCCRSCFESTQCVVAVFVESSGDCNLHTSEGHSVAAAGSLSCHTGRVPTTTEVEWVVPPNDEFLAGLTVYDLM